MTFTNFSDHLATKKRHSNKDWARRHDAAIMDARRNVSEFGKSWLTMASAWIRACDDHLQAYETTIGHDGFAGEQMEYIGRGLLQLLNMDLGPALDCGTLDHGIRSVAEMHDINLD